MNTKGNVETTTQTSKVKKRARSAKVSSSKTAKPARPANRSSNGQSGKLVCRYCGSDDLAPSFKKRRDARCRACFKSRYGSSARSNKAKKAGKAKAKK
jgi:hypothetical protein